MHSSGFALYSNQLVLTEEDIRAKDDFYAVLVPVSVKLVAVFHCLHAYGVRRC